MAGPPGERPRPEARLHFVAAQAIVTDLLRAEPANPQFRALQARCLLAAGRRRAEDPEREAALEIYRTLVREHPEVDQYALELCQALSFEARRDRPLQEGPGGEGRGRPVDGDHNLAGMREARDLAQRLLKQQPSYAEYRALRARIGSQLGRHLVHAATAAAEAGDREGAAAMRTESESELRTAIAMEAAGGEEQQMDPRRLLASVATRAALASLLADTGRADEARAEAVAIVELMRQLAKDAGRGRWPQLDRRVVEFAEAAVRRGAGADVAAEFRELRDRILGGERPERGAPGQPPRRRQ
jgi:tetratricopeptide (TPR) repeat protein